MPLTKTLIVGRPECARMIANESANSEAVRLQRRDAGASQDDAVNRAKPTAKVEGRRSIAAGATPILVRPAILHPALSWRKLCAHAIVGDLAAPVVPRCGIGKCRCAKCGQQAERKRTSRDMKERSRFIVLHRVLQMIRLAPMPHRQPAHASRRRAP